MLEFRTEKVTERITRIYAFCTELMYLVEGDHTAVLIDTGSGFGSLKAAVDQLTDLPVKVLLTHGHCDHAMGSSEFEDVYLSHKDQYIYEEHGDREFRLSGMELAEEGIVLTEADYIPTAPFSMFRDLKGGDTFDIGGETIEIYDCPGHTRGSVVMLMKKERVLLLGDACNTNTFVFSDYSTSIEVYWESLIRLKEKLEGAYDLVLSSHGDGVLPNDILASNIALCDDIMAGKADDIPFEFRGEKGLIAKAVSGFKRCDGGSGNIIFSRDRIFRRDVEGIQQS